MDLAIVALLAWLALNMFASLAVLRDRGSSSSRRYAQLAVVWLLPVLGAILCAVVASVHAGTDRGAAGPTPYADNAGGDAWPAGGAAGACHDVGSDGGGCGGD